MSLIPDLWRFMRARKKYWLFPAIVLSLVLGGLIVLAEVSPAIAPMIYTFF